jgi:hypothetical protein
MAIKLVSSARSGAAYWGVPWQEVGINISRMQVRFFPEVDERIKNASGETVIRSVSTYFSREITCEGELTNNSVGIIALTLGAACLFNTGDQYAFTPYGGTFLLDEATVTSERRGWRSVSVRASSNPWL